MQALHKMRGLSAVRGLWQSANLPTPTVPEEPAAEAAATRGTDSPPLTPRSHRLSDAVDWYDEWPKDALLSVAQRYFERRGVAARRFGGGEG